MKYVILITVLLCSCSWGSTDVEQLREDYRECLLDRVTLVDKMEEVKIPKKVECPTCVVDDGIPDDHPIRRCLYAVNNLGTGDFNEREEFFRICWNKMDDDNYDRVRDVQYDLDNCKFELNSCKQGK